MSAFLAKMKFSTMGCNGTTERRITIDKDEILVVLSRVDYGCPISCVDCTPVITSSGIHTFVSSAYIANAQLLP